MLLRKTDMKESSPRRKQNRTHSKKEYPEAMKIYNHELRLQVPALPLAVMVCPSGQGLYWHLQPEDESNVKQS